MLAAGNLEINGPLNETQPKLSGLVLTQPTDSTYTEAWVLYAAETYNLYFNADLVLLSSRENGIGKLGRGEGLMALTRGYLYAGTPNIIFSLWKVYDIYTKELMVEFYRNVVSGQFAGKGTRFKN
ncbi:MAG: CHAT domain-containing protein [bacterium]